MQSTRAADNVTLEFDEVIAAHGAAIARVAAAHERVLARRDELVQEILLAVWQSLPRFKGESSLKTFVLRIAHNRSIDHVLKERRQRAHDPLSDDIMDHAHSPEQQVSLQQRAQQLLHAVQQLPMGQRELVALALEGCSHQDIAEIIGISVNNVAVRLSRARSELSAKLES